MWWQWYFQTKKITLLLEFQKGLSYLKHNSFLQVVEYAGDETVYKSRPHGLCNDKGGIEHKRTAPSVLQKISADLNANNSVWDALNSAYNEVAFNEKLAITKESLHTKYTPFTYKYIALNEKPPIMKQNPCIFFFIIDRVECTYRKLVEECTDSKLQGVMNQETEGKLKT